MQANYRDQFNLFILALVDFERSPVANLLSYYQIAGIHGEPYVPYDNVTSDTNSFFGGYCTHSSILFVTWHRPYVALFEVCHYVPHAYDVQRTERCPASFVCHRSDEGFAVSPICSSTLRGRSEGLPSAILGLGEEDYQQHQRLSDFCELLINLCRRCRWPYKDDQQPPVPLPVRRQTYSQQPLCRRLCKSSCLHFYLSNLCSGLNSPAPYVHRTVMGILRTPWSHESLPTKRRPSETTSPLCCCPIRNSMPSATTDGIQGAEPADTGASKTSTTRSTTKSAKEGTCRLLIHRHSTRCSGFIMRMSLALTS